MGYVEPHPRAIRAVVITSKALVVACFATVLGAITWNEVDRWKVNRQLEEQEVRTAAEWRKAVHKWNEEAQHRQWVREQIEKIKAETVAAKQQARNGR